MFLINLILFQYIGMGCWGRVGVVEQEQIIMIMIIVTTTIIANNSK
jgi:hypothetical protein